MSNIRPGFEPFVSGFRFDEESIKDVYWELWQRAVTDRDECYGYIPGYEGEGVDHDLPACKAFAENYPTITVGDEVMTLNFSYLLLSLRQQIPRFSYHLDEDDKSGLNSSKGLRERVVVRAILNLSDCEIRRVNYLDVNPNEFAFRQEPGYRVLEGVAPIRQQRTLRIPKREMEWVSGAIIPANKVPHFGEDNTNGRFVASYGAVL